MNSPDPFIHYISFESPLGWVLLASSSKGLCLLHFCGNTPPSENEIRFLIRSYYPQSTVESENSPPFLKDARTFVLQYLENRIPFPSIDLDLSWGTPFRQKVWKALCEIPFGETRSYQEVAQSVGVPQGARAVGQACSQNPIALVVPCHRVLAKSGKLGGYSGGLPIKKALLALEQQHFKTV